MDIYIYIIVGMSTSFLLMAGLFIFYLRYRKGLLLQQYKMQEAEIAHQKDLLHTVITSQEKERSRIGMDLHDQVGAALSSLRLMVENLAEKDFRRIPEAELSTQVKKNIDGIIDNVRNIAHDLSPRIKGEYGFYDSISDFCDVINHSGKVRIMLAFANRAAETFLQGNTATAVYRVLAELVTNTLKHAQASEIGISFTLDPDAYHIVYSDNGIGLPPASKGSGQGMGFRNIESRLNMIDAKYSLPEQEKGLQMIISLPVQKQIL